MNEGHEYRYEISRIIRHSSYDVPGATVHDSDIALLELTRDVEMTNYIQTVCVPSATETDNDYYEDCFLTGL